MPAVVHNRVFFWRSVIMGLYVVARVCVQVGAFPHYGGRWAEWNGGFRDTVRQFLKGTEGPWAGNFASALCGSPNLYANTHPAETDW